MIRTHIRVIASIKIDMDIYQSTRCNPSVNDKVVALITTQKETIEQEVTPPANFPRNSRNLIALPSIPNTIARSGSLKPTKCDTKPNQILDLNTVREISRAADVRTERIYPTRTGQIQTIYR